MGTGIDGTIHTVHDLWGNVIAEADTTGQTVREYLWIPEVGHAGVSLPIAVIDNVDTTTPVTYYVHTDHLSRPILMTDGAKATVWQAEWSPWGAPHSITASPEMNQRFPGQWYQLEAGLHYNWHRHYDPSLGRYTQPDPLGFVDGPSVFAYARNDPQMYVDPDGRIITKFVGKLYKFFGKYPKKPGGGNKPQPYDPATGKWAQEPGILGSPAAWMGARCVQGYNDGRSNPPRMNPPVGPNEKAAYNLGQLLALAERIFF